MKYFHSILNVIVAISAEMEACCSLKPLKHQSKHLPWDLGHFYGLG